MARILALDVGRDTGWAAAARDAMPVLTPLELAARPGLRPGSDYYSGTWKLPEDWGHRGIQMVKRVQAAINDFEVDEVVWEVAGYQYKSQAAALGQIGCMMAAAMACRSCHIRFERMNTVDVCLHAISKPKDPKKAGRMRRAADLGWECNSTHEVDARWILSARLAQIQQRKAA